jgi:hypothetical protein
MKRFSSIPALTITAIAVKTYMAIAIVWSISATLYQHTQSYISGFFSSTNFFAKATA